MLFRSIAIDYEGKKQDLVSVSREITVPVHLWHGSRDGLVPTDMVQAFAHALPNAQLTVLENDTHLCVFHNIERLVRAMQG